MISHLNTDNASGNLKNGIESRSPAYDLTKFMIVFGGRGFCPTSTNWDSKIVIFAASTKS